MPFPPMNSLSPISVALQFTNSQRANPMKILVFEWLIGGGIAGGASIPSSDPFLAQGAGMYGAILDDCLTLGAEVLSPLDPQYTRSIANFEASRVHDNFHVTQINTSQDLEPALKSLAQQADHIFLIAPECDGILNRCLGWLNGFQSKLVCGPQSLIETFADKNATQQLLKSKGIAVPNGTMPSSAIQTCDAGQGSRELFATIEGASWPLVVKPSDGAGGDGVSLCHKSDQLSSAIEMLKESGTSARVERYVAGTPVSVSIVRNQHETRLLPGSEQRFSNTRSRMPQKDFEDVNPEPIGHFVESVYPLQKDQQLRAAALADAVAAAFPTWRGYLGVDMVLADDGPDVVVELNPRLTASYATIRAETRFNLIEFLLDGE